MSGRVNYHTLGVWGRYGIPGIYHGYQKEAIFFINECIRIVYVATDPLHLHQDQVGGLDIRIVKGSGGIPLATIILHVDKPSCQIWSHSERFSLVRTLFGHCDCAVHGHVLGPPGNHNLIQYSFLTLTSTSYWRPVRTVCRTCCDIVLTVTGCNSYFSPCGSGPLFKVSITTFCKEFSC